MPAKTRRDIFRLQVIGECWRTVGSLGHGLGPGALGTDHLRLHGQRHPHTEEQETLEKTKREILNKTGGRE